MFNALLLHRDGDDLRSEVAAIDEDRLPDGDVLVDVAYSSLNYKDGLAITGRGKIIKGDFPFVPGIDLSGTVTESSHPGYKPGDEVVLTGWSTGESRWGGFAEKARAFGDHLVALPKGITLKQAMTIGTAGFTSMLAVMALEEHHVRPESGEIVVTGASGGAGSVAIALLAKLGYTVVASTGKGGEHDYLRELGAAAIIDRDELGGGPTRPLEAGRWAGAVDCVGGATLASVIARLQTHGSVASLGMAQSPELATTVFPFILRGVNLLGIDSNTCPKPRRDRAWQRLASLLSDADYERMHQETISLYQLPDWADRITRGQIRGRVVVQPKAS